MIKKIILFTLLVSINSTFFRSNLPSGFSYIQEEVPSIILEIRYAGTNNFTGRKIPGYKEPLAILTTDAIRALRDAQKELNTKGYCLKIYDAYRPQQAVDFFVEWSRDNSDTLMKPQYYPNNRKGDLFALDYIASQSGHSRGSTVDVTLVDMNNNEIDMGSRYDYFGPVSHHNSNLISDSQKQNRQLLKNIMEKHGFSSYSKEWWHYTLQQEPFPDTYFNFAVE